MEHFINTMWKILVAFYLGFLFNGCDISIFGDDTPSSSFPEPCSFETNLKETDIFVRFNGNPMLFFRYNDSLIWRTSDSAYIYSNDNVISFKTTSSRELELPGIPYFRDTLLPSPKILYWNGKENIELITNTENVKEYVFKGNKLAWIIVQGTNENVNYFDGTKVTELNSEYSNCFNLLISKKRLAWISSSYDGPKFQIHLFDNGVVKKIGEELNWKSNLTLTDEIIAWREENVLYYYKDDTLNSINEKSGTNTSIAASTDKIVWSSGTDSNVTNIYLYDGNKVSIIEEFNKNQTLSNIWLDGNNIAWSIEGAFTAHNGTESIYLGNLSLYNVVLMESSLIGMQDDYTNFNQKECHEFFEFNNERALYKIML